MRSAGDESTSTQSRVSRTIEASDIVETFSLELREPFSPDLGDVGGDIEFVTVAKGTGETCRDVSNKSNRVSRAYRRPR